MKNFIKPIGFTGFISQSDVVVWSPASLSPLFWAGGFDPASGRMWLDSAGVTPVTAPGQPVGLVSHAAGTADASQATALSRPTLVRWPKGGRRNLLTGTEDLGNAAWAKGRVTVAGPNSIREIDNEGEHLVSQPAYFEEGEKYTASLDVVSVGGRNIRIAFQGTAFSNSSRAAIFDATSGEIIDTHAGLETSAVPAPGGGWRFSVTATAVSSRTALLYLSIANGSSISFMGDPERGLDLTRLSITRGPTSTYQCVTTANDVTEAGVPDVWHLWDDGGDSLPAVFPAGNLHIAYVNEIGAVSYSTATSDGATGVDLLLAERMADVIVLDRAFTHDEESKIEAYWARYAA